MVHYEHNRLIGSGTLMILVGCFLFVTAPLYLTETPELGGAAIVAGFAIGGAGFYKKYRSGRRGRVPGGGGPHRPAR